MITKKIQRLALIISLFAVAPASPTKDRSAEEIFAETCVVCHGNGMHGAPMVGSKVDWEFRLSYGLEEVYLNTIEGIGSAMPARGLCTDCSDEALKMVVDFMIKDLK